METLLKESKEFKFLFDKSKNLFIGRYSSLMKGDGLEFVDLKEYIPGDDIRKIDWKVTARQNKPFVKEFLEEKDANHYIFLDISGSMFNKSEVAKLLSFSILISSKNSRDNFSINFFNKEKVLLNPLSKSNNNLMKYLYEIYEIKFSGQGNLKDILYKIFDIITKRAIITIITDELELNEETIKLISAINKRHKLNYFHLYSEDELFLYSGLNALEDIETGETNIYDLSEEEILEYVDTFHKQLKIIKTKLEMLNVNLYMIDVNEEILSQIKERKI